MKNYVLGFVFNRAMTSVLLMQKNRPDWQKGKHNGIGGKIEEGETALAAMVREAREEADIESSKNEWAHILHVQAPEWKMEVFAFVLADMKIPRAMTDEPIFWYKLKALPATELENVSWLVHIALDKLRNGHIETATVVYK